MSNNIEIYLSNISALQRSRILPVSNRGTYHIPRPTSGISNIQSPNFISRRSIPTTNFYEKTLPRSDSTTNYNRNLNFQEDVKPVISRNEISNPGRVVMVRTGVSLNQGRRSAFMYNNTGTPNSQLRDVHRTDNASYTYVQVPQLSQSSRQSLHQQPILNQIRNSFMQKRYFMPGGATMASASTRQNLSLMVLDDFKSLDNVTNIDQKNLMQKGKSVNFENVYRRTINGKYFPPYDKRGFLRVDTSIATENLLKKRKAAFTERFEEHDQLNSSNFAAPKILLRPLSNTRTTWYPVTQTEKTPLLKSTNIELSTVTKIDLQDSEDTKACKQVLQNIINQICENEKIIEKNQFKTINIVNATNQFLENTHKTRQNYLTVNSKKTLEMKGFTLFNRQNPRYVSEEELNKFIENLKKEVNKRRSILEHRAEEEIGIQTPWRRTRTKSVKTFKKQFLQKAKENAEEAALKLCDPRFITLGGNTVPENEIPMKMELDLSGNAKFTTAGELAHANDSNDESTGVNNKYYKIDAQNDIHNRKRGRPLGAKNGTGKRKKYSNVNKDSLEQRTASFASLRPRPMHRSPSSSTSNIENSEEEHSDDTDFKSSNNDTKIENSRFDFLQKQNSLMFKKSLTKKTGTKITSITSLQNQVPLTKDKSTDLLTKDVPKYCSCGGSYDAKKFYISCKLCNRWYHGKCVNITEKKAQKLMEESGETNCSGWICVECEKEQKQNSAEVYCVCRKPYDDTKFYVGCDSCEDWFHPECIGTTQNEVSKCDTFLCPKCRDSDI